MTIENDLLRKNEALLLEENDDLAMMKQELERKLVNRKIELEHVQKQLRNERKRNKKGRKENNDKPVEATDGLKPADLQSTDDSLDSI